MGGPGPDRRFVRRVRSRSFRFQPRPIEYGLTADGHTRKALACQFGRTSPVQGQIQSEIWAADRGDPSGPTPLALADRNIGLTTWPLAQRKKNKVIQLG
jgi:hypothetical protein